MKWKIPEKFLKKDKLILIILVGILLLVIKLPTKNEKKNENVVQTTTTEKISTDYASKLEGRLEKLLSKVNGVGKVTVAVTLVNTGENILYTENDSSTQIVEENDGSGGNRVSEESSLKQSVIFSDNGATPYVVDSNMPKVQGVVVVAEGADDAKIVSEITDAVNALLGIPVNRIKGLKMEV